ncbi:MAG TPA: hypothetical protein VFK54_12725 [Candidatus Limnocylindrales bacterium]|nr:hypothetical protein [Candidatus Limnocylindrales bacterium]
MPTARVTGFLPSTHGFRFANRFPPGPTIRLGLFDPRVLGIGDAAAGLCGGMVLTVRDLFEAGIAVPSGDVPPANGSARFVALVRRQVQSLDWLRVPLRYFDLQAFRPDPPTAWSRRLGRLPARVPSIQQEWPRIRSDIDAGRLTVVGLIRVSGMSPMALVRNHQVLAYAYDDQPGELTVHVYDPNHPGRDDVALRATFLADPSLPPERRVALAQSTGERLLGFFRQPYPRPGPLTAWR